MHQKGKHWIELGVLALLGVLATPLACGGTVETTGAAAAGGGSGGIAGSAGSGNVGPCGPACYSDGAGVNYRDGGYFPNGGGGSGNIVGVDDGSDIVAIGGAIGYDDGAPGAAGLAGDGGHH
jgi:hypothetical protein